jgi:phosphoribosyl 1,2-cyclic phosphodiesterase
VFGLRHAAGGDSRSGDDSWEDRETDSLASLLALIRPKSHDLKRDSVCGARQWKWWKCGSRRVWWTALDDRCWPLDGILLTHEHGDHVRGLKVFLKQHSVPVFTTPATGRVVREAGIEGGTWKYFEAGQVFGIGALTVETFAIQHDAVDPVGFVIGHGQRRLGFLSDAGFVTRSMTERLRGLAGLFCEANYDSELLEADTKRPWSIKQRISSRHGHLSNEQVTELIREIAHADMGRIVLGHLSSDCNSPEMILAKLRTCLTEVGHAHVDLHCAGQDAPTDWFGF